MGVSKVCLKSMASRLLFSLVLICLCFHTCVYGIVGEELQGLTKKAKEHNLHHDPNMTDTTQKVFASHVQRLTEKASQTILLSKVEGYSNDQSFNKRLPIKELTFDRQHRPTEALQYTNHFAVYSSKATLEYYGLKASLNVWGSPNIKAYDQDAITATIWVINEGDFKDESLNSIQAGWHVVPSIYHDNDTHFFIAWTLDGFRTNCVNLQCPGFVLNNSTRYVPGNKLQPLSSYGGTQYYITLKISKDPRTGDWQLHVGDEGTELVGYWPKSLFTGLSLANSASRIDFGGSVFSNKSPPPMGSGHYPKEGDGKAAWFKHIQYVNKQGLLYDPGYGEHNHGVDKCYDLGPLHNSYEKGGWMFYYGGPGGCSV